MKKKIKSQNLNKWLALPVIALLAMVGMVAVKSEKVKAVFSFQDKVAVVAGEYVGRALVDQLDVDDGESVLKFGSLVGDEVNGNYFTVGRIQKYYNSVACSNATSTLVSVINPHQATSSIVWSLQLTGTSTNNITYDLGTSTLPSLTSAMNVPNAIRAQAVATGTLGTFLGGDSIGGLANGISIANNGVLLLAPDENFVLFATSTSFGLDTGLNQLLVDTTFRCNLNVEITKL